MEMKIKKKKNHYYSNYDTKDRFNSYWHQIDEIVSKKPKRILEIGIGNGFVSRYLKNRGFDIITLDVDKSLRPDCVSTVLELPFSERMFDLLACYEVLEHLPFKFFKKGLLEISRVSKSNVILSLPDSNRYCKINIEFLGIINTKRVIQLPRLRRLVHNFDADRGHYWEIGKLGHSLGIIRRTIEELGFRIEKTYRLYEWPYHRFFILTKPKQ